MERRTRRLQRRPYCLRSLPRGPQRAHRLAIRPGSPQASHQGSLLELLQVPQVVSLLHILLEFQAVSRLVCHPDNLPVLLLVRLVASLLDSLLERLVLSRLVIRL